MPQPPVEPAAPPPAAARQRWRVVFGRSDEAATETHRDVVERFERKLAATGLPLLADPKRGGRPRLAFAAPLPQGMAAEREAFDLWLTALRPVDEVRRAIVGSLADGYRLIDLHDVWLGAPALAGAVRGAVYRIALDETEGADAPAEAIGAACRALLDAASLPRVREKGSGSVAYDLRPLLEDVHLVADAPEGPRLEVTVRIDPSRGEGRPEEVVAALSDALGRPLRTGPKRRERLLVEGD